MFEVMAVLTIYSVALEIDRSGAVHGSRVWADRPQVAHNNSQHAPSSSFQCVFFFDYLMNFMRHNRNINTEIATLVNYDLLFVFYHYN